MLCKVHRPLDNHSEWLSPVLQFDEIINLELHTQIHHMIMNEGGWEKKHWTSTSGSHASESECVKSEKSMALLPFVAENI